MNNLVGTNYESDVKALLQKEGEETQREMNKGSHQNNYIYNIMDGSIWQSCKKLFFKTETIYHPFSNLSLSRTLPTSRYLSALLWRKELLEPLAIKST